MITRLWPRLPFAPAKTIFDGLSSGRIELPDPGDAKHPRAYFAPVGDRVSDRQLQELREEVVAIAGAAGFPDLVGDTEREGFDLAVIAKAPELFPMGWAEAGSAEVWTHLALVTFPDITYWRWQHTSPLNRERCIASDLTRHTWSRLWWRCAQLDGDTTLLESLGERNLNQFLERRDATGSSRELIRALAKELNVRRPQDRRVPHELVREANKLALRQMAFIDDSALDCDQREAWVEEIVAEAEVVLGTD